MNSKIIFQNDFTVCLDVFEIAKVLYSRKDYEECLSFINESIEMMNLTNSSLFSDFLSLTGNILWKEFHYEQAINLWRKALTFNADNRAAQLCLKLLADRKIDYGNDYPEITQQYKNAAADSNNSVDEKFSVKLKSEYL